MPVFDLKAFAKTVGLVALVSAALALLGTVPFLQIASGSAPLSLIDALSYFAGIAQPYIVMGRQLLNNFLLPGAEFLLDAALWCILAGWLFKFTVLNSIRLYKSLTS